METLSDIRNELKRRETLLYGLLNQNTARHIDELILESRLQRHEVIAAMIMLEVHGFCRREQDTFVIPMGAN